MTNEITSNVVATNSKFVVTPEQRAAATRATLKGETLYFVKSAHTEGVEYTVRVLKVNGKSYLTCTCLAGEKGFHCWHKRAALADAAEVKALHKEQMASPMDVTDRFEYPGNGPRITSFRVEQNGKTFVVLLYGSGMKSCECELYERSMSCEHIVCAVNFEQQFHEEVAMHALDVRTGF